MSPQQGSVEAGTDGGFSLIELMMAMLLLVLVMTSLTSVLVNSLMDTAYSRQRGAATNLANQTVEEIRALSWGDAIGPPPVPGISTGMTATDAASGKDPNISVSTSLGYTVGCFRGQPLDIGGFVQPASACSAGLGNGSSPWIDPPCVIDGTAASIPSAAALVPPAPVSPHQTCYTVGKNTYGVDVYVTGADSGTTPVLVSAPLTVTVVVTWAHPIHGGLSDHVVTTTKLSPCLRVGQLC